MVENVIFQDRGEEPDNVEGHGRRLCIGTRKGMGGRVDVAGATLVHSEGERQKISWNDICFPKKEGGLRLKDVEIWNISSMMRHVWSIFAKSGSIWVAWVHEYLLKGRSFWNVSIPYNSSWCWRKLLKIRSLAWGFLRFDVGNGSNIHLWVDNWHPFGALFDRFGFRVMYDSNSRLDAKLDTVLKQGNWCWRPACSEDLVAIQSRLMDVPIGGIDKPV
jgi:hypothetical protein